MTAKLFKRAYELAKQAHAKQKDRSGQPYFDHCVRVKEGAAAICLEFPQQLGEWLDSHLDMLMAVAILHDACEDEAETGLTYTDLLGLGFPEALVTRLKRLDKRFKIGTYQQNIQAMVEEGDLIVMIVKLADNRDNLRPERIATLRPEERSIALRYERSAATLELGIANYIRARAA